MAGKILIIVLLAVLGGVVFVTDRRATAREVQSEANYPPEGEFVTVNGREVHAVVMGSGPDLVLIHGAGGSTRDMTFSLVERLTDDFRVIVFDRPGLGYTERTDDRYASAFNADAETPAEQAALLQAAAAALGADRPLVLGHSFGGAVALAWALNHPEAIAGLIDVSGASMPWPGDLGWFYEVNGSTLGGAILPPLITAYAPEDRIRESINGIFAPNPTPEGYHHYVGADLAIRRDNLRANTRQVNTLRPHVVAMAARYASLTLPVEIVHGDADVTVPLSIHSEPLSRLIPGAVLTVLPGIGHMPHHADPEAVVAAIHRAAERAGLR